MTGMEWSPLVILSPGVINETSSVRALLGRPT